MDENGVFRGCVYQIYPRSFRDGNGDGIGDLPGMTSKLDYLSYLGAEALWVSPFFKSPQKDFGYDISDYLDVSPEYGVLADADAFIREAHRLGMRVILDLVLNHTSDEHPWFIESSSGRNSPKRDWYVWKDGRGPDRPPNNWRSKVSGSGWHFHEGSGQWYWAAFLPFQPDLNYRNPEVREAMLDVIRFWLDRGADGFRFDILGSLFEDEDFRDNPFAFKLLPGGDDPGMLFRSAVMTENHPDTLSFVRDIRKAAAAYPGQQRFLLGELFGSVKTLASYCAPGGAPGLDSAFVFQAADLPLRARAWKRFIAECVREFDLPAVAGPAVTGPSAAGTSASAIAGPVNAEPATAKPAAAGHPATEPATAGHPAAEPATAGHPAAGQGSAIPACPAWVLSNHDRARWISLHGNDEGKARLAIALILSLPGVPVLYYGEELGMRQADIPMEMSKDAVARQFLFLPGFVRRILLALTKHAIHRDGCRTPMQWDSRGHAGFCPDDVAPWLPVHPCKDTVNAAAEREAGDSMLVFTAAFLAFRKERLELREGGFKFLPVKRGMLAFSRGSINVFVNFGNRERRVPVRGAQSRILASNRIPPSRWKEAPPGDTIRIHPGEIILWELA